MGRNPSARARHELSKVSERLPRRAQTGANSRVQATGRLVIGPTLARHSPRCTTRNPDARAKQALLNVLCWLPRRPQTGSNSRVQAAGGPPIGRARHWPRCTTWKPDDRATQELLKVRCCPPRRAQTGAYSKVQACGRPGAGRCSTATVQPVTPARTAKMEATNRRVPVDIASSVFGSAVSPLLGI
jgi:hypothetical protein